MFYARNPDDEWINFISALTRVLNSSKNDSIGRSSNEVVIGFIFNDSFGVVSQINDNAREFELKRKIY